MKKLNTAAMCCLILAMSLLSGCGSSNSGGGGLPTPPSDNTADTTHPLAATVSVRTGAVTTADFSDIASTTVATAIPATVGIGNLGAAYALFPVPAAVGNSVDDEGFSAAVYRKGGRRMVVYRADVSEVPVPIVTLTLTSDQSAFANLHRRTTVIGGTTMTFTADGAFYDGTVLSASRRLLLVENEYSAIGVWMSREGELDQRAESAGLTGIGPGFATPTSVVTTLTGMATYTGNAIGSLNDDREVDTSSRAYLVYGESGFTVQFDSTDEISGGVTLRAYNVNDAIQDGSVSGDSALGTIAITLAPTDFTNIFSDTPVYTTQTEANLGVFRGLINSDNDDFAGSGPREFNGGFYGPDAEEIAGFIQVFVDDDDDEISLNVQFAADEQP